MKSVMHLFSFRLWCGVIYLQSLMKLALERIYFITVFLTGQL